MTAEASKLLESIVYSTCNVITVYVIFSITGLLGSGLDFFQ